ncbi:peptidase E [Actinocatenispora thailandica]|uniref:Peptidase E n=1 Tax=Actinocatenispora thailandica TaxID=227318 RepID=A0A7R7DL71_9ACTN|nr:Type 1 glutamine amidotransferase-like domain-containing protein [Actinocatenispora thailandica]BCJ33526.1 peptidase E [Actinocatenispora thailandica]
MRILLTSAGVQNATIRDALVDLLGKPIAEARALCVPTGIYPFPGGPDLAGRMIRGLTPSPLCDLGWKSLGILELTALPSIDRDVWTAGVRETDALLVWGGDPLYLAHWMRQSGLTDLLPSLRPEAVYVGVSAGAMAATALFGETYPEPPNGTGTPLTTEHVAFPTPDGPADRTFVTARGAGLVDFAVIPHLDHEHHPDASLANAATWAAKLPVPTYAIDDESAVTVVDGAVEVVSEGHWRRFDPAS